MLPRHIRSFAQPLAGCIRRRRRAGQLPAAAELPTGDHGVVAKVADDLGQQLTLGIAHGGIGPQVADLGCVR